MPSKKEVVSMPSLQAQLDTAIQQRKVAREKLLAADAKLKALEQKARSRERAAERKARTRRLIKIGASVEAQLGPLVDNDRWQRWLAAQKGNAAEIGFIGRAERIFETRRLEDEEDARAAEEYFAAVERGEKDGETISHEEIMREFGA